MRCPISTFVAGQAASMASLLLAAGEKGRRYSLPHARIMLHQPSGGAQASAPRPDRSQGPKSWRRRPNRKLSGLPGKAAPPPPPPEVVFSPSYMLAGSHLGRQSPMR